ncbi:b277ebe3-e11f-4458-8170-7f2cac4964bb [Thermothielavioides terrestris]|uniref:B277ebe3-e11f-4458-8170-7f2cac4964bb n=1 Tax=Thermothielavioides terrestris TaxID=2587410 RepID=A0A3S4AMH3_9PEZI|nr:b277ebe3-e11f-4458-8170-7f2cac4964bb [Thermothielavioides terrestris]
MDPASVPDFDDLPKVDGQPQGCAWGLFDKDGKKDVFGTLNFLTPSIVAAAAAEVKDGVSISLNWPLNGIKFPLPGRKPPVHRPKPLRELGIDCEGWDDELDFNTQFSSQWDGLCHFTPDGATYNGLKPTQQGLEVQSTAENGLPTIEHWHSRGALVGRGVLIDWKRFHEETTGTPYHPLDGYRITPEDIEKVARHQGVEFKHGDILIIRTGYTEVLEAPTQEDFAKFRAQTLSGVHGTVETARWVWNHRFAAVAGDAHAFEALPPLKPDGTPGSVTELVLHHWFLNQFGMPIGELWDLKALSEYAKKTGRYSFLLTSAPLNHPGLVASPPNAIALF